MSTELSMETPRNHGDARDGRRAAAQSALRGCLLVLLDVAGKLAVPMAVVAAALVGYSLTGAPTVTQPVRSEDPDAALRAKMFEPISERLFGAKSGAGDLQQPPKAVAGEAASSAQGRIELAPDAEQDLLAGRAKLGGSAGERATPPPVYRPRRPTASSRRRTSAVRSPPRAHRCGPAAGSAGRSPGRR